jgi:hypothetical protein
VRDVTWDDRAHIDVRPVEFSTNLEFVASPFRGVATTAEPVGARLASCGLGIA